MIASNHPLAPTHLPSVTIRIAHRSDVGCVRSVNEDSYLVYEPKDPFVQASRGKLVVLADGMGGTVGGDTASRLVVKATKEAYYDESRDLKVSDALTEAIKRANLAVYQYARQNEAFFGMGSTCTAMAFHGRFAHFGHVGDSRIYLVRDHRILQLTDDHSKVAQMVRQGELSASEARYHPDRGTVLRWMGTDPELKVDTPPHPLELKAGDRLLLCSDGLTTHVGDVELLRLIDQRDPRQATDRLVELAKARGGSDNITVLVIQVVQVFSPAAVVFNAPIVANAQTTERWSPPSPIAGQDRLYKQWRSAIFALGVVLAMAAVSFWIYERFTQTDDPEEETAAVAQEGDDDSQQGLSLAKPSGKDPLAIPSGDRTDAKPANKKTSGKKGEKPDDILAPESQAEKNADEKPLYPDVELSASEEEPEIRAPLKGGRAQVIRGRALDKAVKKLSGAKSPVCTALRKKIAEKLGVDSASTEDFVQAVARYQLKNGLSVVGHPGPQTRTKLFGFDIRRKVCAKAPPVAEQPQKMP